jgi:hypothetical protein
MPLRARVGRHSQGGGRQCQNWPDDQGTVIALLNRIPVGEGGAGGSLGGTVVAGQSSEALYRAIIVFEDRYFPGQRNGFVEPGGPMLRRMEELAARTAGSPAKTPQDAKATDAQRNPDLQDNRTRAILRLGRFQDLVMARAEDWQQAARLIGSAYATAAGKHKEVVDNQSKSDALDTQILFSILTVATSGALSWVCGKLQQGAEKAAQKGLTELQVQISRELDPNVRVRLLHKMGKLQALPTQKLLIDAVEDMAQAGVGEALSATGPLLVPPTVAPVSQDPLVFQNDLENRVSAVKQQVLMAFGKIKGDWADAPLDSWDKFDDVQQFKQHESWKKAAAQLPGADELPDLKWMAEELERGIWARYVLEQHSYRDFGIFKTTETPDWVGLYVFRRLRELRVKQALDLPDGPDGLIDPVLIGPNQAYVESLWDWAKGFEVTDFLTKKKGK